jgi:hypothetical protein
MLARSAPPGGYAYEWDGFRAIVHTGADLRVRSRSGCARAGRDAGGALVLNGELVALGDDGCLVAAASHRRPGSCHR